LNKGSIIREVILQPKHHDLKLFIYIHILYMRVKVLNSTSVTVHMSASLPHIWNVLTSKFDQASAYTEIFAFLNHRFQKTARCNASNREGILLTVTLWCTIRNYLAI